MADYSPETAAPGTADDAAIRHEHGLPITPSESTKVEPLTTADIAPKKAKAKAKKAKKAAPKKRR